MNDKFINVMGHLKKFPNASPMVLTNGRRFSDFEFTKNVVLNSPFNTQYAIPLYSAVPAIHDQIVGTKGAFRETINGIYNLTRFRIPIEIRIVLTRQTIPGLVELAEFIGWNLPMVVHVAFMGMEIYGRADKNRNEIWIEPRAYVQYLYTAVKNIAYRDLDVSIYNLPLCLLPKSLWKYSERSISDWKQGYLSECAQCVQKDTCGGFFTTSSIVPKGIHKIV
jgi:His-Xaa-Ser system radical SAM maturase HxsC